MNEEYPLCMNCGENEPEDLIFSCKICGNMICEVCSEICKGCGNYFCDACIMEHKASCKK
ncbi:MAG: hypothetical protein P8Y70_18430 [Candidatus Lokiarchaeota archaeon]